jgi:hypothetical protein
MVHKGYRVRLRRELACGAISRLEVDIFVVDFIDSDCAIVAHVLKYYPGFTIELFQRLVA